MTGREPSAFLLFSSWAVLAILLAKKWRYFTLPKDPPLLGYLSVIDCLFAFLIYLSFQLTAGMFAWIFVIAPSEGAVNEVVVQGWAQIMSTILALVFIGNYVRVMGTRRVGVLGDTSQPTRAFSVGLASWLFAFPIVSLVSLFLKNVLFFFRGVEGEEQVVVTQLKSTMSEPFLLVGMILLISLVVPVVEELLFRGFLQNYFAGVMSRWMAIAMSSLIFTMFHFSAKQGLQNLELLPSLFLLSLILGYNFERTRSIWGPVGLHVAFNSMSSLFLVS